MELLQWCDSFNVGIKLVDHQHQKLFSLINELIIQTREDQQKKNIDKVLDDLINYLDYHFKTEEKYLKIHPGFKHHQNIHKNFIDKVSGFLPAYKTENRKFQSDIIGFLREWIREHFFTIDMIYFHELGYSHKEEILKPDNNTDISISTTKILVVDDSMDQRLLLKTVLEKSGYKILEAQNGVEALKIFENNSDIRIVITDIKMPGIDGYELILALRNQQIQHIYIIVVTSLNDKKSIVQALSNGADDFLTKPVFPQELHLRIQSGIQLIQLESQDELIFSMAKLADYRSNETGLHLERVRQYTLEIGKYLALHHPEKNVTLQMANEISRVSPLHDIGKVGISDAILKKPGILTHEEFEIMKEHSKIGGDLISDIYLKTRSPTLRIAFELTMYHHEKWDGTGYPAGISGKGIPIAARIMALADLYDALTSKRVYKETFSHEKAKEIIIEGRGKHFDPDLVDVFLVLESKFNKFKISMSDE